MRQTTSKSAIELFLLLAICCQACSLPLKVLHFFNNTPCAGLVYAAQSLCFHLCVNHVDL